MTNAQFKKERSGNYQMQFVQIARTQSSVVHRFTDSERSERPRSVVVKRISNVHSDSIRKEVFALGHLRNVRSVVDLYYTVRTKDYTFLALEDLRSGCIGAETHSTLDESGLKSLAMKMLRCIRDIHAHNIVHGDIKPGNFCIDNGDVKLIDFGNSGMFATMFSPIECTRATWFFASPEQFLRTQYPASDMYSLGVTLLYLSTGSNGRDFFPKRTHLSTNCEDFLKKCLRKNPEARLTAEEALKHPLFSRGNAFF